MLDFYMASRYQYGLPERSAKVLLEDTLDRSMYRLTSLDVFPHKEWDPQALYSAIPYITGHSTGLHDESIAWMAASETWVELIQYYDYFSTTKGGRFVNFITESGQMEFFLFASASTYESAKRVQKKLCTITGFPMLPPIYSLGFHYSKWEDQTSVKRIMYYNE